MLNIKSLILVSFAIIFLLNACDTEDIVTPQSQKRLIKITTGAEYYSTFSYQNGLLIRYESIENSQLSNSVSFNYDYTNRVTSAVENTNNFEYLHTYVYNTNQRIEKISLSYKDSTSKYLPSGYIKYIYDSAGNVIGQEKYNSQDELNRKTEFEYDANGNMVKKLFYPNNMLYSTLTSTYDNKINPWYGLRTLLIYPVSFSINNATYTHIIYENGIQGNSEYNISYSYDKDGYPVSRKLISTSNGITSTINSIYEYE